MRQCGRRAAFRVTPGLCLLVAINLLIARRLDIPNLMRLLPRVRPNG